MAPTEHIGNEGTHPPQHVTCGCGVRVPIESVDVDSEVYCPSCGAAIAVVDPLCVAPPAGAGTPVVLPCDAPASTWESVSQAPRPQARIFGITASEADADAVVDHLQCLCGQSVPVTLADFEGVVYCRSCAAELPVAKRVPRFPQPAPFPEPTPVVSRPPATPADVRPFSIGWALGGLIAVATVMIWVLQSQPGGREPPTTDETRPQVFTTSDSDAGTPGRAVDPAELTPASIDQLRSDPDTFVALTQAVRWRQFLIAEQLRDERIELLAAVIADLPTTRAQDFLDQLAHVESTVATEATLERLADWRATLMQAELSAASPLVVRLDQTVARVEEQIQPITLAEIHKLESAAGLEHSLLQAYLWREQLSRRQLSAADPRPAALEAVIAQLEQRRLPPPAFDRPEPEVEQFLAALTRLSNQIDEEQLNTARTTAASVQSLLDLHPQTLGVYRDRLVAMLLRLEQVGQSQRAAESLLEQLARARELAGSGQLNAARQLEARVQFMALGTPLTRTAADRLRQAVADLGKVLRRATGVQAAADAVELAGSGDQRERNILVQRALRLLAEFPAAEVAASLESIHAWKDAALAEVGIELRNVAKSRHGRLVLARDDWEQIVELFATRRFVEFTDQAENFRERHRENEQLQELSRLLSDCLLEAIELDQLPQAEQRWGELQSPPQTDAEWAEQVRRIEKLLHSIQDGGDADRVQGLLKRVAAIKD